MKTAAIYIIVLLSFLCGGAKSDELIVIGGMDGLDPYDTVTSYPILLALSGGGARGLTTIGILRAFEQKNIRIEAISGTSMGGIIGGLYAAGYGPDELETIARRLDFDNLFSNSPSRRSMFLTRRQGRDNHLISIRFDNFRPVIPKALSSGQELTSVLTSLTSKANYHAGDDFTRLPIPFKTISTDIITGESIVLDRGSLSDAMRSTMAFPLAFTGLEIDGRILMDGGMVTPIPVELVRTMSDSTDYVVAINTASILAPPDELVTPVDIANQVTSIMTADKLKAQLAQADYIITPPISTFRSTDFREMRRLIEIGYQSGSQAADSIAADVRRRWKPAYYLVDSFVFNPEPTNLQRQFADSLLHGIRERSDLISRLKQAAVLFNLFRLEARLECIEQVSDTTVVILHLQATANLRFSEVALRFKGVSMFDLSLLAEQFLTDDSIITLQSFRLGLQRIRDLYASDGYDLVGFSEIVLDPEEKTISITVDEAIVTGIDVDNNGRTRDWYIRSHFPLKRNEPYSTTRAARGLENIYGTDLFDRVTLNVRSEEEGALVKIVVEERDYLQLKIGWHWEDDYQSEEFIEFLEDNVAGVGLEYLLHARYAADRQQYYFRFKTDRIWSTYLTSRLLVYHNRLERHRYSPQNEEISEREEKRSGAALTVGQQIARLGAVTASVDMAEVTYRDAGVEAKSAFGIRSLIFESTVETYNRVPFTESGSKHLFQLQFAGEYLGGDVEFTRFYTSHEIYIPLGSHLNFHPRFALGLSRSGLPPTEQFYLGGLRSFIGLHTFQLAGDKMINISNELRLKLPLQLYFGGRYDLGEVYNSTDQIKLRNLRHGIGGTLAFDSPIGPAEIGYGSVDSHIWQFYVNIGFDF